MLYSTKQFCLLTGISTDTLRHYVDTGLIKPAMVKSNGYRLFSLDNAVDVLFIRNQRGIGSSIGHLQSQWEQLTLEQQESWYETHLEELQRKRKLLDVQQERTEYFLWLTRNVRNYLQGIRTVAEAGNQGIGNLRFLEIAENALEDRGYLDVMQQWMRFPELCYVGFTMEREQLKREQDFYETKVGLGIREKYGIQMDIPLADSRVLPPGSGGLQLISHSESLRQIPAEALRPLIRRLAAEEHPIMPELVGRLVTCTSENGKRTYYFTLAAMYQSRD